MERTFSFSLSLYYLEFFSDTLTEDNHPYDTPRVDISFGENSKVLEIPLSELENFRESLEFPIKVPRADVEAFLMKRPVIFKFMKRDQLLGESRFNWSEEFCKKISRDDFISNNFTHVLGIVGPDSRSKGQFKLSIAVAKKPNLSDEASDIEEEDIYIAICDDGRVEDDQEENSPSDQHECVGGLINLVGCGIERGDRVKLARITLPDGRLGCSEKVFESTHRQKKENEASQLTKATENESGSHLVSSDDGKNSVNPQLMTNKSGSFTFRFRLCNEVFSTGQLSHKDASTVKTCSTASHTHSSVKHAIELIRTWGKGRTRPVTLVEADDDDACSQMRDALQMLRDCEEDYSAKALKHRPTARVDQMKYCYRSREIDFRKRKKSKKYVKWPGRRPLVHYTSHKNCASTAELVPGNMGWKWNVPIVGLNARGGWRPGYIHGHIKKLMEYFLMPLSCQKIKQEETDSLENALTGSRNSMDVCECAGKLREKVIKTRVSIKDDRNCMKKHLRIKIPQPVKSYMEELAEKSQHLPVSQAITQGTQYTVRDYMPWIKPEEVSTYPKKLQISLTTSKPSERISKLPKFKGMAKETQGILNPNQSNNKGNPKASTSKAPTKLPIKAQQKNAKKN